MSFVCWVGCGTGPRRTVNIEQPRIHARVGPSPGIRAPTSPLFVIAVLAQTVLAHGEQAATSANRRCGSLFNRCVRSSQRPSAASTVQTERFVEDIKNFKRWHNQRMGNTEKEREFAQ
eukprot:5650566-Pyramimonas_sp.AAC.1